MNGKRILGLLCIVVGCLFAISGALTVMEDENLADRSGLGVSRAVGAFLPSVLALIIGLWLIGKARNH